MRFHALATDYDGTIAHHGKVDEATIVALERAKKSGRKLVLVTGRELPDLLTVFPRIDLFDKAVMENGATVYDPKTKETRLLAEPPPPSFAAELKARGVGPISVGRVIVATWEPHQAEVLEDHPRPRPRTPGHLQQGRGDDAAQRREQGHRPGRGAGGTRPVAAQRRRRRRRRERSRFPACLRVLGRGRQRAAGGQGHRRHRHEGRSRRGRRGAHRPHARQRPLRPEDAGPSSYRHRSTGEGRGA